MRSTGLTVEDAAELLGAAASRVREALTRGEFPGRYLRGGVLLLPRPDVEAARGAWRERDALETHAPSLLSAPPSAPGLAAADIKEMRSSLVALLREERSAWLEELLAPLDQQGERLARLEDEVRELRRDLRTLGAASARPASLVSRSPLDLEGLVREISDLEALLSDIDASDAV